jgi:3-oxoacyl-[acyl-carrier-protein] synthase-3
MPAFPDKEKLARAIKSTGVEEVRYASPEQTAGDLCLEAARAVLSGARANPGAVVFVSSTPDYLSTATSPILQSKLGLSTSTLCFDINYGCSGYIYGLLQAAMILNSVSQMDEVLVLTGETASKTIDPADSSTALIFGDSGAACLVRKGRSGKKTPFFIQTDGSGYEVILKASGGYRNPQGQSHLFMDGTKVLNFVTGAYQPSLEEFFERAGIEKSQIARFYFHQANKLILDYIAAKSKLDREKVPASYREYGNTGGGSVPLTMAMDLAGNPHPPGALSLISGFGVGLSWGHTLACLNGCISYGILESEY